MSKYICHFKLKDQRMSITVPKRNVPQGLTAFKDGFWLNGSYKFTSWADWKFWVPPGKIEYIELSE